MSDLQRFDTLCDMQLITPTLRDQVLKDPRREESGAYPGLSHALLWLVVRHLLSEDELAATESRLRSAFSGEAYRERQAVLDEVKSSLRLIKQKRNHKSLSTLLSESLINRSQFDAAERHLPDDDRCVTPGATLAWAIFSHHVPMSDFENLQQRRAGLGVPARAILDDTQEAIKIIHKVVSANLWQRAFPGPRWAWVGGAVLFIAGFVWWSGPSTRTPDCDDKEVRVTLSTMLSKAMMGRRLPGSDRPSLLLPKGIRSLGYDSKTGVRGCTCTIDLFGMPTPFAYTIEPQATTGEFNVVQGDPDELAARFASRKDVRESQ